MNDYFRIGPAIRAFVDLGLAGIGWGMPPESLARPYIATGALVELIPDTAVDVTLYWTQIRLHSAKMRQLLDAVRTAAASSL